MPFSYGALKDAIAEFGRDMVTEQANLNCGMVDLGQMPGKKKNPNKVLSLLKKPTEVGKVIVKSSGFNSTGFVADGGSRATAAQGNLSIGQYGFKLIEAPIYFPEGITRVAQGGNGIDLFQQAMESGGADVGRTLERAFLDHELGAVVTAPTTTTFTVSDASGFRVGQAFDRYASNGTSYIDTLEVSTITLNADGSGTVAIVGSAPATALAAAQRNFLKGSGGAVTAPNRKSPVNFGDLTDSTNAIYSGLAAADQPAGVLDSSTTTLSNTALRRLFTRVQMASGELPTHIVVHPINAERIYNNQNGQLRYNTSETIDSYGPKQMFANAEIVETFNQGVTKVDVINAKEYVMKVHEFFEPSPSGDGLAGKKWSKESLKLSETTVGHKLLILGGYELRVERRNAHGRMSAITA